MQNLTCEGDENDSINGTWNGDTPSCKGFLLLHIFSFDVTLIYQCLTDDLSKIYFSQQKFKICQNVCAIESMLIAGILCPALPLPTNGEIDCSDGNKYNSTCVFICDEGYAPVGEDELTCISEEGQQNGLWDETPPECKRNSLLLPYLDSNKVTEEV